MTILSPKNTADAAIQRAESLYKTIEDHIVDVNHKTLQLTASIGLSLISETTTSAEAAIDQAVEAMEKARAEQDGNAARLYEDRKSTRLNSSHVAISYAVFCLKKKTQIHKP